VMSLETFKSGMGWMCLVAVFLLLGGLSLYGQDYTIEEYNEFQKAVEEGEDSIIQFVKAHPESSLVQYAVGGYLQRIQGYVDQGQHREAVVAGEKFLEQIDPDRFEVLYLVTWSSFYSQQYDKAAKYGEQVRAFQADAPQILPILARAFLQGGNTEKAILYGEKYCADVAPMDCYDLLPTITRHHADKRDWDSAARFARLTVEAFEAVERPAQVSEQDWTSFVNEEKSVAHAIMGRQAFESKRWNAVETHFDASRRLTPRNRARSAEGYYYIGMARWNQDKIRPAKESFARGSLIPGTDHTDPCRRQLERLYRATHNGSLAGIEEFLERLGPGE
jgi:tetratricopeptide (TPR) repeat protein